MLADGGVGAHIFGDGKTFFEPLLQLTAHRACIRCETRGLLHLSQDLRLTQDHRIHAAGDCEGVCQCVMLLQNIHVLCQLFGRYAVVIGQPLHHRRRVRERWVRVKAIDFHAVTGREHGDLG